MAERRPINPRAFIVLLLLVAAVAALWLGLRQVRGHRGPPGKPGPIVTATPHPSKHPMPRPASSAPSLSNPGSAPSSPHSTAVRPTPTHTTKVIVRPHPTVTRTVQPKPSPSPSKTPTGLTRCLTKHPTDPLRCL